MKTKGLDKTQKLKRLPIQMGKYVDGNNYKFMDYLIYRYGLEGYQIRVSTMVEELHLSKPTVLKLCKVFKSCGFLIQDEGHCSYLKIYRIDYNAMESFIYKCLDNELVKNIDQLLNEELVKNIDQTGKESLPTLVKNIDQFLVKNIDHTRSSTRIFKEVVQEPEILKTVTKLPESEDLFNRIKKQSYSETPENKLKEEQEIENTRAKLFTQCKQEYIKKVNIIGFVPSDQTVWAEVNKKQGLGYKKSKY